MLITSFIKEVVVTSFKSLGISIVLVFINLSAIVIVNSSVSSFLAIFSVLKVILLVTIILVSILKISLSPSIG